MHGIEANQKADSPHVRTGSCVCSNEQKSALLKKERKMRIEGVVF